MFKSVQQGGDDNWKALAEDLHRTKITAKTLEKERASVLSCWDIYCVSNRFVTVYCNISWLIGI